MIGYVRSVAGVVLLGSLFGVGIPLAAAQARQSVRQPPTAQSQVAATTKKSATAKASVREQSRNAITPQSRRKETNEEFLARINAIADMNDQWLQSLAPRPENGETLLPWSNLTRDPIDIQPLGVEIVEVVQ